MIPMSSWYADTAWCSSEIADAFLPNRPISFPSTGIRGGSDPVDDILDPADFGDDVGLVHQLHPARDPVSVEVVRILEIEQRLRRVTASR